MRLLSFRKDRECGIGAVVNQGIVDISKLDNGAPRDMRDLLELGPAALRTLQERCERGSVQQEPLDGVTILPPVPRPGKILCLGLNYIDHAKEGGYDIPEYPVVFMRGATTLVGHRQSVVRPTCSEKLDYEVELAVIIGRRVRHLTMENALSAVAGYSVFNDVSLRDYQRRTPQWTLGKNFDATGPFGPWIVTADELPPGAKGLRITTRLNGRTLQDSNTSNMIFDVPYTLVTLTEVMTLEPGDVVIMGTPPGVGHARKPPLWMKPGDTCEVGIEGIGVLSNPVVAEND